MTEKPYPKWVGVLLGLLLHGSAQFLSGSRGAGLRWYFGLLSCGALAHLVMAIPGTTPYVIGIALLIAGMALWVTMLARSYRPVRRIGFLGWVAVAGLSATLGTAEQFLLCQVVRPFKVPTGAMQPTLLGKHGYDVPVGAADRPGIIDWLIKGERFIEVKASAGGTLAGPSYNREDAGMTDYEIASQRYSLPRFAKPRIKSGEQVSAGDVHGRVSRSQGITFLWRK